jgi:hypothetical protein
VSAVAPLAALGSDEHTDLREVGEEIEIRLRAALSALVAELVPGD